MPTTCKKQEIHLFESFLVWLCIHINVVGHGYRVVSEVKLLAFFLCEVVSKRLAAKWPNARIFRISVFIGLKESTKAFSDFLPFLDLEGS